MKTTKTSRCFVRMPKLSHCKTLPLRFENKYIIRDSLVISLSLSYLLLLFPFWIFIFDLKITFLSKVIICEVGNDGGKMIYLQNHAPAQTSC
jgi:hypothetical protein